MDDTPKDQEHYRERQYPIFDEFIHDRHGSYFQIVGVEKQEQKNGKYNKIGFGTINLDG